MSPRLVAAIAIAAANLLVFLLYGLDKALAKLGWRRVSERTLLVAALLAAPGAWSGMLVFRHKTQKTRFRILVPLLALAQAALAAWAAWRLPST